MYSISMAPAKWIPYPDIKIKRVDEQMIPADHQLSVNIQLSKLENKYRILIEASFFTFSHPAYTMKYVPEFASIIKDKVSMVVAISSNGAIGKDGVLPWHIPEELQWFREATEGKVVVMGRRTWDSLPCKPLPYRHNIVLTTRPIEGIDCCSSVEAALRIAGNSQVVIIGGSPVYGQAMPLVDTIYVSEIPMHVEPPFVAFPWTKSEWQRTVIRESDHFTLAKYTRAR